MRCGQDTAEADRAVPAAAEADPTAVGADGNNMANIY